nr:response regulator transcription factor [uncultured Anaerostipes sp.]
MRLLLAEDERSLSRALVTILNRNGFEVDAVYDGKAALEAIESGNYDGVVLDIMMPKMNGLEVLKTIRDKENLIPILMLTAKAEIDDKVEGLDLGANDYLTKPFAAKELLARIRTMIRTQTTQTESILHVGNITLNRATFELTSPTGSFRLANKEFQMMELFLCNKGHSITHKRLMEKIWGDEKQVQTNVVWMYISYLRKKLEALHANLQITEASHAEYILEVGG